MASRPARIHAGGSSPKCSRVAVAVAVGIAFGCFFAFAFPAGLFVSVAPAVKEHVSTALASATFCESSERIIMLTNEVVSVSEKNVEWKRQIKELMTKLQMAEQAKDNAEKQFLALGEQHKAGSFGTVKALRTSPTIVADESVNPRLAKIYEKVAVMKELIVSLANRSVKEMLEVWFTSIQKVGIPNYLVVALDNETMEFCNSKEVPVYWTPLRKMVVVYAISGLKFRILREFFAAWI